MTTPPRTATAWFALALAGACSAEDTGKADTTIPTDLCEDGTPPPCDDPPIHTDTDTTTPGPEDEDPVPLMGPAQSDRHLFIANPDRNSLTRIDVFTHDVRTTPVGRDPTLTLVTADHATAAVLDRGDDTVSLVSTADLATRTVPVRDDLNRMVQSPDGQWLALWHDPSLVRPEDPAPDGMMSLTEVSLVHVPSGEHHPLSVGLNVREVVFTPDGGLGAVVTDFVVALVDLTVRPPATDLITLTTDLDAPKAEELALAPSGEFGLLRRFGDTQLLLVDLVSGEIVTVDMGDNPTDIDITPDGSRAVALARASAQLWTFDLADPHAPPEVVAMPDALPFGQLVFDPRGHQAVLYTNATPLDRYGVWNLTSDQITLHAVVKPIQGVSIAPEGGTALIFHPKDDVEGADPDSPFFGAWALTVLSLDDGRTNPLLVPAEVLGFAHAPDGTWGTYILRDQLLLDIVDYRTLLHHERRLPSIPVHVGVMLQGDGAGQPPVWASQEHELGRITFYDHDDGSLETITGFELNGEVETE